ncbi:MAG: 16S rRNA (adenine(1518)-N(6)/adenine(1519)-N(6))-dimethyltransferase RsmA [Rhodospirillales bacterium]|nr:16S rRNA (adenine(1518)-N(6)/adenine(1519)-N(6))-dimethyltransferase RsmA [Rhodospirillales bacterium]
MTELLPALPPLTKVIQRHGLSARKELGQHFLLDPGITRRIAAAAGSLEGRDVIEIGPGPGGLTRALLESPCRRVIVVEKDSRCLEALAELAQAYPGRLEVVADDALKLEVWHLGTAPRKLVANLPYNVATPLLIGWLQALDRDHACLESLTLMFQKEVGQRLVATPGTSAYGRLSIVTQWLTRAERCFDLPPGAFKPPPRIVSSVLRLTPHACPSPPARLVSLERVAGAAFGQRRKMLRQSLKRLRVDTKQLLAAAGIEETLRAETLTLADFCRLAQALDRFTEGLA